MISTTVNTVILFDARLTNFIAPETTFSVYLYGSWFQENLRSQMFLLSYLEN